MALVLIVDDSPTELHIFSQALERGGHETIIASDGEEAIQKAESERPDVILMDIVMPGMNGYQATRKLTRNPQTAGIPVIMITSKDQETDRIWGLRQGAVRYLSKPVDNAEMLTAIAEVLGS
jgi:twitching motility two-component system response regulator PilH